MSTAPEPTPEPTPATSDPAPAVTNTTTGAASGGGAAPATGTPTPEPAPEPTKSFTQDDVNSLLARQKRELLGEAPDLTELRRKAKAFEDLEEASRSDLDKAKARAEKAEKALADAQTSARDTNLRAAIIAEAAKADRGVIDPAATVALLDRSTLDIADDGTPTNIAQAMDALLEAKPYLVDAGGPRTGTGADQGARAGGQNQLTEAQLAGMNADEIVEAQRAGRLTGLGVGGAASS